MICFYQIENITFQEKNKCKSKQKKEASIDNSITENSDVDSEKNECNSKQKKEASADNSIIDNSDANSENVLHLKEWVNGDGQPDSNAVYLLSRHLLEIIADDDDDIKAKFLRTKFHYRMVEDDRIHKKLCKIVPKMTYYFEDKTDYFRNLDDIFDALNDKIWNYIGKVALLWY